MQVPPNDANRLLIDARSGSRDALGQVLEACRGYLLMIAGQELDPDLVAKGGASDLVQETLLDAVGAFDDFRGNSPDEVRAWLRRILLNNVVSFVRRYRETGKRQVGQEVSLSPGSSAGLEPGFAAADPSPSNQAMEHELTETVRRRLETLPEDYRRVLRLRYEDGLTFEDIGRLLELTPNAARKLWLRAVRALKQDWEVPP